MDGLALNGCETLGCHDRLGGHFLGKSAVQEGANAFRMVRIKFATSTARRFRTTPPILGGGFNLGCVNATSIVKEHHKSREISEPSRPLSVETSPRGGWMGVLVDFSSLSIYT